MHVAPSEDDLDAVHLGRSPVLVEHRSQLRVDAAFDHVGGRIPFPSALLGQGNEREQHVLAHELVEATPGLAKALMGVEALAVLDGVLLQKAIPSRAPGGVIDHPSYRSFGVLHLEQALGRIVGLPSAIELGSGRGLALDLAEHMEQAPLDARCRPHGTGRLREASGPVGHSSQKLAHLRLKVRPHPAMSFWAALEKSRRRKASSCLAEGSMQWANEAPQPLHRHRCPPDEANPLRFIAAPHGPHLGSSMPVPSPRPAFSLKKLACTGMSSRCRTHILSE